MTITIEPINDGGNPRNRDDILKEGNNQYTINPFSEDNDPNYKFRCECLAKNESDRFQRLFLTINWAEPLYNQYRSVLYHKKKTGRKWLFDILKNDGSSISGHIDLPPGESIIASQPSYSHTDYLQMLETISMCSSISKDYIGETNEHRKIYQIVLESQRPIKKPKAIVLTCRIHPYETAGSYCAEGIIDAFANGLFQANPKLKHYRIHLIPMANPDGVYNGLCKRTSFGGTDLAKSVDPTDNTSACLVDFLDNVRPEIYCEIHNWMLPDFDGIYFLNRFQAYRLKNRLNCNVLKKWKITYHKLFWPGRHCGLKKYCHDKFNSKAFVLEFPWFDRTVDHMKEIGVCTLNALIK